MRRQSSIPVVLVPQQRQAAGQGPPKHDFFKVWKSLANGGTCEQGVQGTGKAKKVRRLRSALAEALRPMHRRRLAENSESVAINRDESKHRLLFHYVSTSRDLEVRSGVLGWVRCTVTDAATLVPLADLSHMK